MRSCPVCEHKARTRVWSMPFKVPDGWPLPVEIDWYTCDVCGMLYGDGPFDQEMLNQYYRSYYGYGINSVDVNNRLTGIADEVAAAFPSYSRFVDFGGSGDDGKSIACTRLEALGWRNAVNVNAGEPVPGKADVILMSHVLEHIYDVRQAMDAISAALQPDGMLIVDGPEATGIALEWGFPLLDFHTKHINHFRTIDYLRLMDRYGLTLVNSVNYVDVRSSQSARCIRMYFRRVNTAEVSRAHVVNAISDRLKVLEGINYPVNVWVLGDITWHLLGWAKLDVVNYIDNDPAYRGATYDGKPVMEQPDNDLPIVILAQGQREKLIKNIRAMGVTNKIVEV